MTAAARKHLLISCGSVSTGSAFRALTAVVGRGQLRVECGGRTVYDSTPSVQQKQRLAIEILACRFLDFCAGAQAIPYFCPFRPCLFSRERHRYATARADQSCAATSVCVLCSEHGAIDKIIPYHKGVHAAPHKSRKGLLRGTHNRFL